MKSRVIFIIWNDKKPIYTIDFSQLGIIATAGADNEIKLWRALVDDYEVGNVEHLGTLSKHQRTVNVCKFSTPGNFLASGSDDGVLIIWQRKTDTDTPEKETWNVFTSLSANRDIYDISWSPDSKFIIAGSTDNSVYIADVSKGEWIQVFSKIHDHFVQGVCWDPRECFLVSVGSDRICHIYEKNEKSVWTKTKSIRRRQIGSSQQVQQTEQTDIEVIEIVDHNEEENELNEKETTTQSSSKTKPRKSHLLFLDETSNLMFRRPTFSPDGSLLFIPAGQFMTADNNLSYATYVFARGEISFPCMALLCPEKTTIARCNPLLFVKRNINNYSRTQNDTFPQNPFPFDLQHRIIVAIASLNSIYIYDLPESVHPVAIVSGIHYASITDITWDYKGYTLFISSKDGFCSSIHFTQEELGTPIPVSEYPDYYKTIIEKHSMEQIVLRKRKRSSKSKETHSQSQPQPQTLSQPNFMNSIPSQFQSQSQEPVFSPQVELIDIPPSTKRRIAPTLVPSM